MAREYAQIQTSIWGNPDVRALPLAHQGLYLQMWTHPSLSYVGVLDWRPARLIAPLSAGSTAESISAMVPVLERALFAIVDEDTEELLLRSYLRHDGVMRQPNTAVSMANAYAAVGSNMLRGVIIHELHRLQIEHPEWKGWAVPRVVEMMKHPAIDPRSLQFDPSAEGSVDPYIDPSSDPSVEGQPDPSVGGRSTTTATSTTTEASLLREGEAKRLPEMPLPKSWAPTAEHVKRAQEQGLDLVGEVAAFRLHAETHDRRAARWNAAFTTWLSKARPRSGPSAWDGYREAEL